MGNMRHQHWKVRKATLDALAALFTVSPKVFGFIEEAFPCVLYCVAYMI